MILLDRYHQEPHTINSKSASSVRSVVESTLLKTMIDRKRLHIRTAILLIATLLALSSIDLTSAQQQTATQTPSQAKPWLRHLRFNSQGNRLPAAPITSSATKPLLHGTGSAVEVPASSIVAPAPIAIASTAASIQVAPSSTTQAPRVQSNSVNIIPQASAAAPPATINTSNNNMVPSNSNRAVRTADIFQNGEGYNMFVTNTCERETMRINVRTSKPFFGVIHTRDHRAKSGCSVEGTGASDYNLDISQVLNPTDPAYCGALRGPRETPQDSEIVSLVVAVRVHKSIERSDDRFFLLNCTNRCRKPDCSSPSNARLTDLQDPPNRSTELEGGEREFSDNLNNNSTNGNNQECTIYKFPWAISLLWCLGIMCIALIISHCFLCSSLVCRCVRKEVEEQEPSIYGDGSTIVDYDASNNKPIKSKSNKQHPFRIEYDNRDIYKTSNNYDPYKLNDNYLEQVTEDEDCLDNRERDRTNKRSRHHQHHPHHGNKDRSYRR